MLFDVQAALAEILGETSANCDFRDSCDLKRTESRKSQVSQSQPGTIAAPATVPSVTVPSASVSENQRPNRGNRENRNRSSSEFPQPPSGSRQDDPPLNADGYARTWTGRVVSLADWRALSEWDRHGPNGRLHCGICRQWVERDTPCRENGCWKGEQREN